MVAFPKLDHVKWPYLGNLTLATAIAPVIGINDLCFAVSATPASNQANYSSSSNPTTNFLVSADTPAGGTSNGLTIAGVQATDANVNAPLFAGVAKERQTAGSLASSSEVVPEWVGDIACVSASFKIGDSVTVVLNSATTADSGHWRGHDCHWLYVRRWRCGYADHDHHNGRHAQQADGSDHHGGIDLGRSDHGAIHRDQYPGSGDRHHCVEHDLCGSRFAGPSGHRYGRRLVRNRHRQRACIGRPQCGFSHQLRCHQGGYRLVRDFQADPFRRSDCGRSKVRAF